MNKVNNVWAYCPHCQEHIKVKTSHKTASCYPKTCPKCNKKFALTVKVSVEAF